MIKTGESKMKSMIVGLSMVLGSLVGMGAQASDLPLVMIATVKVQPGFEVAFKAAAVQILAPTRAEEGNISYEFHQSPNDPTEFATVEVWRSQADIDKHMGLPHMQNFFGQVGGMFAPGFPVLKTYQAFEE
jgi:quinol monooxygenase YgiN